MEGQIKIVTSEEEAEPMRSGRSNNRVSNLLDSVASTTVQVPDDLQREVKESGLGCCQTFRFFLKHSFRDVARRKCHFCLGLCSVLIVVLSTLVVNTVVSKGPIIFMKLA